MRNKLGNIFTVLLLLVGVAALLYPTVSDYWNRHFQSTGEAQYNETVKALEIEDRRAMWNQAVAYNQGLLALLHGEEPVGMPNYDEVLSLTDQGIICTLHISKIDVHVTVHHGVDEGMLQHYVGHMPSSSMPVGGAGTHCVFVGHRGLPSAKLFTDLDALAEGDIFVIDTLDERLGYEVDQILTVLPHEVDALAIDPDSDLCTLVTCTPYGVNSHRLLVRGHRVDLPEEELARHVDGEGFRIDPLFVMIAVVAAILLVFFILSRPKKQREEETLET